MKEKKMLTITKLDGTVETVEEVISFEFSDTLKKYVTEMVTSADGTNKFVGVESEEEWSKIKDVLRELAK